MAYADEIGQQLLAVMLFVHDSARMSCMSRLSNQASKGKRE